MIHAGFLDSIYRGEQVFRWADNDFLSEEERKKKKLMQTRGNKGRGKNGGKSGRTRDQKVKEKPSCATLDIRM